MAEKEQVKPLTAASPSIHPVSSDEEAALGWRSKQYLRKRRCALWCCGCCGATVVVLGVVILVLSLTVFKVKDPVLTMNALYLEGLNGGVGSLTDPAVSVNATLTADISIENPNVASFRFDNSTTEFYYEGGTVGVAYAPDGKVSAHRTVRMNVTVEVLADRVVGQTNVTRDFLASGELNLTSYTDLTGRVSVFGIYKRDVEVMMNCSMTFYQPQLGGPEVKNKVCQANVK